MKVMNQSGFLGITAIGVAAVIGALIPVLLLLTGAGLAVTGWFNNLIIGGVLIFLALVLVQSAAATYGASGEAAFPLILFLFGGLAAIVGINFIAPGSIQLSTALAVDTPIGEVPEWGDLPETLQYAVAGAGLLVIYMVTKKRKYLPGWLK